MTRKEQIKILNKKVKANNAQYNIDRLNAEISAFSEGDLDKYEFFTGKYLKYKPNAPDKAKFEFSPLGRLLMLDLLLLWYLERILQNYLIKNDSERTN